MDVPKFSLNDKVALITGGSRGIGRAIALAFADAGADVAVVSRKLPDLEKVADEIRGLGRKSLAVPAHVGRMEDLTGLVEKVKDEFGRIDILVNNAVTSPVSNEILDDVYTESLWNSMINTNLKGIFFLTRMVAKMMREQGGGNIVNISSVDVVKPSGNTILYGISKAGLEHFTISAAKEWAKYNIRVNVIALGFVDTRLSVAWKEDKEQLNYFLGKIPMRRIAQPEEVAGAAIYFASDASSYATGARLVIDGGLTIE